ncbi:MAG: long-chain fatty acid--CoA ligase [Proteobacteria bacterium]|nr:long-chain fatty acid--CoA ligase [Pseudomonadota bacterium]
MKATSNWLEAHARFRPQAEALFDVDNNRRWTYAELHSDAQCWAHRLHQVGVGHGDRVALLAHNRGETFTLLFACAELGAILQPMNWRLAEEELRWQLDNAEPKVLLTDETHRTVLAQDVLSIEEGPGDKPFTGPGAALEEPWVLMYTSGSSGRPKGALLTHRQMHWNAVNTTLACDLAPSDSTLTFTPLFHTGGLNCISAPLLHRGGRVVLTRGVDVPQALKLIESEGITLLMGVPTIYQMLADHADFASTDFGTVRDALCGGAPLPLSLLSRYLERSVPLRQGFGLTEVGPNCFSTPPARVREKLGTVGVAIHHIAAKIVRPDGTEADIDEAGELWLKGPVVCSGYWRNPQANANSFVDGWFRTGDVLCRDADGFFSVRGRIKEMFISGGENVYPAEIEAAITENESIGQAAVIGVPDNRWGEVGRAFIEPRPGHSIDVGQLRCWLEGRLARFKLPKSMLVLSELPRTASGKIDKQALRAMDP